MSTSRGVLAFLCACVLLAGVTHVHSQLDASTILSMAKNMPTTAKLALLNQLLAGNPQVYQKIENTLLAALPILGFDKPHGRFMGYMLPWAIAHLPDLLKNDDFLGVMKIFIEELNAHNATADWNLGSGNVTIDREYFVAHLLSSLDYSAMGVDMLQRKGSQDYFPYNSTDRVLNDQCYTDTMVLFDRLFHGDKWALDSKYYLQELFTQQC